VIAVAVFLCSDEGSEEHIVWKSKDDTWYGLCGISDSEMALVRREIGAEYPGDVLRMAETCVLSMVCVILTKPPEPQYI
jgi:hypothetical protein